MRLWLPAVLALCACSEATAPVISCPLSTIAADDFERPDGMGLGVAPTGQPWIITGAGYLQARIEDGRFTEGAPVDANVVYGALFSDRAPVRIGGSFSFVRGPSSNAGIIALISSSDPDLTLSHMVHLIVSVTSWRLTTWNGTDQDREFAEQPLPRNFREPLKADGSVYQVWMNIRGDSVELELPDGTTASYRDPLVSELAGKQTIWELPYDAQTAEIPRWESVETLAEVLGCSSR